MSIPRVAILVINYNGKGFLPECFDSIRESKYPNWIAYLVDNGSRDGSVQFCKEQYPWVNIIDNGANLGFAGGYNAAVEKCPEEYLVLLNNDVKVDPDWLEPLVDALRSDPAAFAAGSKMLLYYEPSYVNHAGAKATFIGSAYDIGLFQPDGPEFNVSGPTFIASGGAMLVKRSDFLAIGGFDGDYFAYFEDADLCWRAAVMGRHCIYVSESKVLHKFGGSFGDIPSEWKVHLSVRNRIATLIKNGGAPLVAKGIFFSLLLDGYVTVRSFGSGVLRLATRTRGPAPPFLHAKARVKAYRDVLRSLPALLRKRCIVQRQRQVDDRDMIRQGWIVGLRGYIREARARKVWMHRYYRAVEQRR